MGIFFPIIIEETKIHDLHKPKLKSNFFAHFLYRWDLGAGSLTGTSQQLLTKSNFYFYLFLVILLFPFTFPNATLCLQVGKPNTSSISPLPSRLLQFL